MKQLIDSYGRVHDYLRISVTEQCNLHCRYCRPFTPVTERSYNGSILSIDELLRFITIAVEQFGITKVRLTGGEPLVRKEIERLFAGLHELKKRHSFSLGITTNGILLEEKLGLLVSLGLDSVNISLDSLQQDTYQRITRHDGVQKVISSILTASSAGIPLKINCVVMRDMNDHEIPDFVDFAVQHGLNVRFIEYMPFTGNGWQHDRLMDFAEIKKIVEQRVRLEPLSPKPGAVSKDFLIAGTGGMISFITSLSDHFCSECNRVRLTAHGTLKPCLFSLSDHDTYLSPILRHTEKNDTGDALYEAMKKTLEKKWKHHPDADELTLLKNNHMLTIGG